MILALDLGTTVGWALGDDKTGNLVASGSHELKQGTWEGGGVRTLRMRHFVEDMLALHDIGAVFYEKVEYVENTAAAHLYGALMGAMASVLESHSVPYIAVGTGQWKKVFTGKGNASKEQVAAVAAKLRPGKIVLKKKGGEMQSDEADAIGILFCGMDLMKRRAA